MHYQVVNIVSLFQVVFYFEYPIEGTYINNPNCVNRSKTEDSLHSSKRSVAKNGSASNGSIIPVAGKPNMKVDSQVDGMSRLHVTESEPHTGLTDVSNQTCPPPTSQSVPELSKIEGGSTLANAQKHLHVTNRSNKSTRLSPTGDRRGRYLPYTNSENSLGNSDMASTGESEAEDNFSDSDTDDEWDGCEVTAV